VIGDRRFPLSWPTGWPRAKRRRRASFHVKSSAPGSYGKRQVSVNDATSRVVHELRLLGVGEDDVLLSSNVALRSVNAAWEQAQRELAR